MYWINFLICFWRIILWIYNFTTWQFHSRFYFVCLLYTLQTLSSSWVVWILRVSHSFIYLVRLLTWFWFILLIYLNGEVVCMSFLMTMFFGIWINILYFSRGFNLIYLLIFLFLFWNIQFTINNIKQQICCCYCCFCCSGFTLCDVSAQTKLCLGSRNVHWQR